MQITFIQETDTGAATEALAEGRPMPSFLGVPRSATGVTFVASIGLVAVLSLRDLKPREARTLKSGRWTIGIRAAGRHATLLHMELKREGLPAMSPDFTFSAEYHRSVKGEIPAGQVGAGTLLNLVVVSPETGIVQVFRRTVLSEVTGKALATDLARQAESAARFTLEENAREAMGTLRDIPHVTRAHCASWEVVRDLPSAAGAGEG